MAHLRGSLSLVGPSPLPASSPGTPAHRWRMPPSAQEARRTCQVRRALKSRQACVPLEVRRGAFVSLAHPIHSPCRGLFEWYQVDRHHQYVRCAGTVGLETDGRMDTNVLSARPVWLVSRFIRSSAFSPVCSDLGNHQLAVPLTPPSR